MRLSLRHHPGKGWRGDPAGWDSGPPCLSRGPCSLEKSLNGACPNPRGAPRGPYGPRLRVPPSVFRAPIWTSSFSAVRMVCAHGRAISSGSRQERHQGGGNSHRAFVNRPRLAGIGETGAKKRGLKGPPILSFPRMLFRPLVHTFHPAARRHGRIGRLFLRLFRNHRLGGEEE